MQIHLQFSLCVYASTLCRLHACLATCLPACLPAYCLLACLRAFMHISLPACLHGYCHICISGRSFLCLPACLPACPSCCQCGSIRFTRLTTHSPASKVELDRMLNEGAAGGDTCSGANTAWHATTVASVRIDQPESEAGDISHWS